MSRPIGSLTSTEYGMIVKSLTRLAPPTRLLVEGSFRAANGDVETAGLMRKLLAEHGVGDDGFVEIVAAAREIAAAYRKAVAVPAGSNDEVHGPGRTDHTTELAPNSQRGMPK